MIGSTYQRESMDESRQASCSKTLTSSIALVTSSLVVTRSPSLLVHSQNDAGGIVLMLTAKPQETGYHPRGYH